MKERLKKLKWKHCVFAAVGLLLVVIMAHLFSIHHVPIKVYYDEENTEVVVAPGFLYTLESYDVQKIAGKGEKAMLPLSDSADSEYRFRAEAEKGENVIERIWIRSRNDLTGERETREIEVSRQWNRTDYCQMFFIHTNGYSVDCPSLFIVYTPASWR